MDKRARDLVSIGDALFEKRKPLLSLWQEIALNFYPERADFFTNHTLGDDFAGHLMNSYPVLARRELGNVFSSMLRPTSGGPWGSIHLADDDMDKEDDAREWLEYATKVQYRAMYDPLAQFKRATREGDHDFATFGQCALSVEPNFITNTLLHRSWHLRDVAWSEDDTGRVDCVHRNWRPTARQLKQRFGSKVSRAVDEALKNNEPEKTIRCRHILVPRDKYGYDDGTKPSARFHYLFVDLDSEHVMEEGPQFWFSYIIPRWQTTSGTQYAYSPATIIALPDARTIQAVTRVLLEAGEKAVDPPMVAVQDAIRSDVALYAGGITWADIEYDERLGEILRPISQDRQALPIGMDIAQDIRTMIAEAFFLNKIALPPAEGEMTAYEVRKRVEEYVRSAVPLFEPMQDEYNARVWETDFEILMRLGTFGPLRDGVPESMPDVLKGQEIRFRFESPLMDAAERIKPQILIEGLGVIEAVSSVDPSAPANVEAQEALRDALRGLGWESDWIADEENVEAARQTLQERQAVEETLQGVGAGAEVAQGVGDAARSLQDAGV